LAGELPTFVFGFELELGFPLPFIFSSLIRFKPNADWYGRGFVAIDPRLSWLLLNGFAWLEQSNTKTKKKKRNDQ
jgi:hypothetical protein